MHIEIKQLKFFKVACDCGSLTSAAAKLYTSQPNISKVIATLEKELGSPLFERRHKGLNLTPYGRQVYQYAEVILKNVELLNGINQKKSRETFNVSTYPGNAIAMMLVDLFETHPDISLFHRQGTVEEIVEHVERGLSEIGILYIAERQLPIFQHIIEKKGLKFVSLGKREACIFIGPDNPFYGRTRITSQEMSTLRYVTSLTDYFAMGHNMEKIYLGAVNFEELIPIVQTNSDHLLIDLLMRTSIGNLGLDISHPDYSTYPSIRKVYLEDDPIYLNMGYIAQHNYSPNGLAEELTERIKYLIFS